jgi:phosphoglycolate phosphatase
MSERGLAEVFDGVRAVLLDFDGPVCNAFAGYPSPQITAEMRRELAHLCPEAAERPLHRYPFHALMQLADLPQDVRDKLELIIQRGEMRAAESAEPTPGAAEFLEACQCAGLPVVIVTNNYEGAVRRYLDRMDLGRYVLDVIARDTTDPLLMKPSPYLVERAVKRLDVPADACAFIGDSITDIEAALAAGVRSIGYANKSGKSDTLHDAGAGATVGKMTVAANAVRLTNDEMGKAIPSAVS